MGSFRVSRIAMLRRSRALMTSGRFWKSRLVFWLGALAIGAISAGFARLADAAQVLFNDMTAGPVWRFLPLVLTPLGFVLCAWAAERLVPGSQGSGIPQAIAASQLREKDTQSPYLSLKMVVGKILLTCVALATGASVGREGPTVQVGASIMVQAARIGGMAKASGLILAGSAAGIAAAFNTPLAGIVFAIEEMSRSYQARTNGVVLSAVIIAGVSSLGILGSYTYFGTVHAHSVLPRDGLLVLVCGVSGGIFGAMFSQATLWLTRRIRRWRTKAPRHHVLALPAAAGLLVAVIGILSHGLTFGTGYDQARGAIEGEALPWAYALAKFVVTLASSTAGIAGGLFAPSLAVGAGLGSTVALILGSNVGAAAVLGMAGYFAGVVQAPMTAFVIIVEMTNGHQDVVPIMAAAMLGYGTSRLISPEPLYHGLARLFMADAIRQRRASAQEAEGQAQGQMQG